MKWLKNVVYFLLTATFFGICWLSFTIYTSLMTERLPWYDSCGMQFLVILVLSCPVMVGIGVGYIVLGRFMPIGRPIKILPFAAAGSIGALIFINGSLGLGMQITGTAFCVLAAVGAIALAIRDLRHSWKSQ